MMPSKFSSTVMTIVAAALSGSAATVIGAALTFSSERSDALRDIKDHESRITKMEEISGDMRDNQIRIMMALNIDPKMPLPEGFRRGQGAE
jgi:hypothetical protein